MRKKNLFVLLLALLACLALALAGCSNTPQSDNNGNPGNGNNGNEDEHTYYTVTFDSKGGSPVESLKVLEGNPVRRPGMPTYEGHTFRGWYRDEGATENLWSFDEDRVQGDLTLYAGWQVIPAEVDPEPTDATASLVYGREGDTYFVKGVGEETAVVIPAVHEGLPVVAIRGDYGNGAFAKKDIVSVVIPDSVTEIGQNTFNGCGELHSVTISQNSKLAKIGNNAFSGCSSLKNIYLPAGVREIGDSVFNNCGSLENITVAQGNTVYRSENGHLIENATDTLIRGGINGNIPSGVKVIGQAAFRRSAITQIAIPASVAEIGKYAFDDCAKLTEITADNANVNFASQDGILYNKTKTVLIKAPEGLAGSVTLPDTLNELPMYAFDGLTKLTEVNIEGGAIADGIRFAAFRNSGVIKVNYGGSESEWEQIIAKSHAQWNTGALAEFAVICTPTPTPEPTGSKILIAYFSCTNNTESIANHIADITGGTKYKITPKVPYTSADLNYNTDCRANREQNDPACRPEIEGSVKDMAGYDVVFLGYPIWWGQAPKILYTFLEGYELAGKTVIPFCTSGSSGIGSSATNLHALAPDAEWKEGRRFSGSASKENVRDWIDGLDISIENEQAKMQFYITVGSMRLTATLEDNAATAALKEKLKIAPVNVEMSDYGGFEKVGDFGFSLPTSNEQVTTQACDFVLYQGNQLVIFYGSNTWSYTRLGKITGVTVDELKSILGSGNVNVTLSMSSVASFDLKSGVNGSAPAVMLSSGYNMPVLGIGTYSLQGQTCVNSVLTALQSGVRLIDTAYMYGNEAEVGQAVRQSGIPREEIFVITKIYPGEQYADPEKAIRDSLDKLNIGYIDMMLLHHPGANDVKAYKAIEKFVEQGKIRSIGLSNWYIEEIDGFIAQVNIKPALVQNEMHPYYQEKEVVSYMHALGIVMQAWYPLGGRGHTGAMLSDETIVGIANAHGVTAAQVILRWHLQRGVVAIPGSSNPAHILENISVFGFELTESEMNAISALDRNEKHDWY